MPRLTHWWNALRFYWFTGGKGNLTFFAVLAVPVVVLVSMARFAYVDQRSIVAERQRRSDLVCLAENVYFEARGEPVAGQRAVAEVTLNRVASPRFPSTVCGVVYEKNWDPIRKRYVGAFAWTEKDSVRRPGGAEWDRAMEVARAVYENEGEAVASGALFYHAAHIQPSWARSKERVVKIGGHVFYE